jgi:ubiquinone/menaquinone biosynthesis C-methylase UbiE
LTFEPNDTCLVLGCGCGVEAGWLLANGVKNVTGLDVAEGLLATCEKTLGIKTIRGDMRKTGLPDKAYDVVITHRSLHHMVYPFHALEEFARIARRKVMVLDEPVRSWLKAAVRRFRKERIISAANIYEYQFVREDVHRYMAFNGFEIAATARYGETMQSLGSNRLLNAFGHRAGNRFSAIYRRFDTGQKA